MPGTYYQPLTRKEFLASTGLLAAGALAPRRVHAQNESRTARVALLSDTHIPEDPQNAYRGFRPVENLRRVAAEVARVQPDVSIINGDAARLTGELGDYQALKHLLQPIAAGAPVHIGLGNHDDRKHFFQVFEQAHNASPVAGKHVSVFELAGVRFVVLDSLLYVDKVAGLLGQAQRNWLKEFVMNGGETPTVFFVHHTLGDGDGDLLDFERVFQILKPHPWVKAVFYGHSHRYHVHRRGHIYLINQPAVGYNFNDEQPVGWLDASFSVDGVSMTLRGIGGNLTEDKKTTTIDWG